MLYRFAVRILTPLAKWIYRLQVKGAENIPKEGKLILCCNHKSVADPILLSVAFERQIRYMAKSELFEDHGKFVKCMMNHLGAFPVKRGSADIKSLRTALKILDDGGVVGIFPQGRCVFDNSPFQPKAGAAMLAGQAKAPVLPACVYCNGKIKPFQRITVRFGQMLSLENLHLQNGTLSEIRTAKNIIADRINGLLEEKY